MHEDHGDRGLSIGAAFRPTFLWVLTGVTGVLLGWLGWEQAARSHGSLGVWISMFDPAVLSRAGGADVASIWIDHQWWRLVTACWLHGGLLHWLVNIISLHALWPWCVAAVGRWRSLVVLVGGGFVAMLASSVAGEGAVVVGLSGGLFALAAVMVNEREGVCTEVRRQVVIAVVVCFVAGGMLPVVWPSGPRLANLGHAAGWAFGGFWAGRAAKSSRSGLVDGRMALHIGFVVGTLILVANSHKTTFHGTLGVHLLQEGKAQVAVEPLQISYEVSPESAERANALAYALGLSGQRLEEAGALSAKALASDPQNSSYLDTRGWIFCRRGDVERGLRLLEEARTRLVGEDPTIDEHLDGCAGAAGLQGELRDDASGR